ncbi:hypothetical protein, partial [Pseudobutyrivibrio sp.]
ALILLAGCKNIEKDTAKNIEVDKGPEIDFSEENIDEYIGGDIYCSLDSFKEFSSIVQKKYETMYIYGEVSKVGTEEWNGGRIRKYIEIIDEANADRYIKAYSDIEAQVGDKLYLSGLFEKDSKFDSGYEEYRAEYKCEKATVEKSTDNADIYVPVSEALSSLDLCYSTKVKIPCTLDGQESFYCELEEENQDDIRGVMCYTSEDLREYDGKWVTVEGNFFIDSYGEYGLTDAKLAE